MIPKKIHYCWLSGDDYPELISKCISSWKKYLPDYELVLWDLNKFPLDKNLWVRQAFEAKKYAFAADYIRLYAVYNEGGIYLDGDVEVLKSFNPLLNLPYFIGSEGNDIIEAGVFGAEKKSKWLEDCLSYYENRTFIKEDGTFDTLTLPRIMMKQLTINHNIDKISETDLQNLSYSSNSKTINMFPKDFFCAKNHGTGVIEKTDNTFCIHHFAMSWLPKSRTLLPNFKRKLIGVFGEKRVYLVINSLRLKNLKRMLKNQ